MTGRETIEYRDYKYRLFMKYGFECSYPGCHHTPVYLAHRISKTKYNLKTYGKEVIHHELNLRPVCALQAHNDYWNIEHNPVEKKNLLKEIREAVRTKNYLED
jgi:hypothetical protein